MVALMAVQVSGVLNCSHFFVFLEGRLVVIEYYGIYAVSLHLVIYIGNIVVFQTLNWSMVKLSQQENTLNSLKSFECLGSVIC